MLANFACFKCVFLLSADVLNLIFKKTKLSGIPTECQSLDQDQPKHFVRTDPGQNSSQTLSADNKDTTSEEIIIVSMMNWLL